MPSSVSSRTNTQFFQGLPTVNVLAEVMRTAVISSRRPRERRRARALFAQAFTSYRTGGRTCSPRRDGELVIWNVPTKAPSLRVRSGPRPTRSEGGEMAADGRDEISKEQREFSRRRFLRRAGVAAAAIPLYGGLAEILTEQGASAATYKRNSDNAVFASHPEVQVRDGQPRHHELVLHGDDLRHPGCVRPDRLQVPVDRFGELRRLPDGRGLQHRDRRQGERHRVLSDRQHRLQQARRLGTERTASP